VGGGGGGGGGGLVPSHSSITARIDLNTRAGEVIDGILSESFRCSMSVGWHRREAEPARSALRLRGFLRSFVGRRYEETLEHSMPQLQPLARGENQTSCGASPIRGCQGRTGDVDNAESAARHIHSIGSSVDRQQASKQASNLQRSNLQLPAHFEYAETRRKGRARVPLRRFPGERNASADRAGAGATGAERIFRGCSRSSRLGPGRTQQGSKSGRRTFTGVFGEC